MKIELVTTLKREATRLLTRLHDDKEPILITEHGRPSAYLVDVESYDHMHERMDLLERIARGEQAIRDGRIVSHQEVVRRMKRKLTSCTD